ncbi:ATP-binding protein, partial [Serratia fonticola]
SIPVPVYVISVEGELESYNSAFGAFFTPELHAAMHHSLFDRRHPLADIFAALQPNIQQGLQVNQVIPHQLVLSNGTEERLILHWLTLCQLPANTPPTLICGWQDITESRQLMEALQVEKDKAIDANRAKSTFLASMSHEIRTPVSAIMGFLELLTTHSQSPAAEKESIQLAYSTAQSLLGLIGDVLDMEKIESGNFELAPEWVDLASLLATTVSSFEGVATLKNLRLSVDYRLEKTQALWLDPQAVKQVLANLLSNAIKFTVEGGIEVIAQTHAQGTDHTCLTLSVKDSGAGISPQEQQHLFKPFSQTKWGKQQTGSGLGLTICRELVERM